MFAPNFMATYPIIVEIFQSGLKWWTDAAICWAMLLGKTQKQQMHLEIIIILMHILAFFEDDGHLRGGTTSLGSRVQQMFYISKCTNVNLSQSELKGNLLCCSSHSANKTPPCSNNEHKIMHFLFSSSSRTLKRNVGNS